MTATAIILVILMLLDLTLSIKERHNVKGYYFDIDQVRFKYFRIALSITIIGLLIFEYNGI